MLFQLPSLLAFLKLFFAEFNRYFSVAIPSKDRKRRTTEIPTKLLRIPAMFGDSKFLEDSSEADCVMSD